LKKEFDIVRPAVVWKRRRKFRRRKGTNKIMRKWKRSRNKQDN